MHETLSDAPVTRYLERALAGDTASADEWNEHLVAFHRAFPNITARLIGGFHTADGETSYQRLARHVYEQHPSAQSIIDVGCGSGELLHELNVAFDGSVELAGIDLAPSELAFARKRVPRATLVCGDVAQMLPVQRADVAVAHLSFLSMARLRNALRRIHDALVPGALLAFIIEDPGASESVIAMMAPLMRALHERYPALNLAVPEHDTMENEVTLLALLKATGFTDAIDVEHVVLSADLTDDQLTEFALRTYPFGLLHEVAQAELRECLLASLAHSKNEPTLVKLPLKLVTARRGDAIPTVRPSIATEYIQ